MVYIEGTTVDGPHALQFDDLVMRDCATPTYDGQCQPDEFKCSVTG